jgi:hypothetical protein
MLGVSFLDAAADEFLGLAIRDGDQRTVLLIVRLQPGLEVTKGKPAGEVGRLDGELEIGT